MRWLDSPGNLEEVSTRVKDVRSLGLDVAVDFHGRLHKCMAKQLAKILEPHGLLFIEGASVHIGTLYIYNEYTVFLNRTSSTHTTRRNS